MGNKTTELKKESCANLNDTITNYLQSTFTRKRFCFLPGPFKSYFEHYYVPK